VKFGKSTGGGALWLDPTKTKPFDMYQYLINTPDEDVEKLISWLTDYEIKDIKQIIEIHNKSKHLRYAQKILAASLVSDIFSQKEVDSIIKVNDFLFGKGEITKFNSNELNLLKNVIPNKTYTKNNVLDILIETKICISKREAKELITDGAIEMNGKKITDELKTFFSIKDIIIKHGKKKFFFLKRIN
jgi:tyrosyl-tRNA synthetase